MWLVPLSSSTVILYSFYFLETHRDRFYVDSGVHLLESNQFHNRLTVVYSHLKSKVGNILTKTTSLCINLILMSHLYLLDHTLTPHILKPLFS
jgi:hypothetical protein